MSLKLTLEQAKAILKSNKCAITSEDRTGNNLGTKLVLSNGCIVNCWDK